MQRPGLPKVAAWCLQVFQWPLTSFPSDNLLAVFPSPRQPKGWGQLLTILSANQGSSEPLRDVGIDLILTKEQASPYETRRHLGIWVRRMDMTFQGLNCEAGVQSQLRLRKKWVMCPEIQTVKHRVSEVC